MTITEFLDRFQKLDIRLWLEEGRLRYSAPEGAMTDELRSEITARKQEIIDFLKIANSDPAGIDRIKPYKKGGRLPLSYAQKWLWLYSQRETSSYAYNIPAVLSLKGRLNIDVLEESINEIIKRHEVLRTTFVNDNNEPCQIIADQLKISLPVIDLNNIDISEKQAEVDKLFLRETRIPFDLERGPLMRASLLVLGGDEYALVLCLHHIVSDNWSLNIFMRELAAIYKALSEGQPSLLPELQIQYADYAVWENSSGNVENIGRAMDFWRERLKGIQNVPPLPVDFKRPSVQSHGSIRQYNILPVELTQKLKDLSRKEDCTLYITLLAAFQVLLHQYSGLRDIIVGTPVAGRNRKELEELIGVFINTVVLWNTIDSDMHFSQLMQEIRKTTNDAFSHQDVPLEMLSEELKLRREQGGAPFIQVLFNMFSASFELELPDLSIAPYSLDVMGAQNMNSKFDIALLVIEHKAGLQIDFSFNEGVFSESTSSWLFRHFLTLLEDIAQNPDNKISSFLVLEPKPFNTIEPDHPFTPFERTEIEQSIISRFEKQVSRQPDMIALSCNQTVMTYDRLNRLANRTVRLIQDNYDGMPGLSKKEKARYQRQIMLEGWGVEAQEKLKGLTVFAAGAGGSGSPTIMQLALLGVGTIIICDFDNVEISNLNRQVLHDESRLGMNKAESAALTVKRLNPHVNVIVRSEKLTGDNIAELAGDASIIFDNLDDIEAKFILSEYAVKRGIPHVISSMIELSSYAAVFHTPHTPCFHCLYDRSKLKTVRELRDKDGAWEKVSNPVASPALFASTGFACNEALKIALGLESVAYNKYFFFNQQGSKEFFKTKGFKIVTYPFSSHFKELCKKQGFDWDTGFSGRYVEEITLEKDPECPLCGNHSVMASNTCSESVVAVSGISGSYEANQQTVGLLLEHSAEMVIGILGVLKSGRIFATMDPDYPEDRLTHILEDTGARVILTDGTNLELAKRIRDKVSRNIKVININEIHNMQDAENPVQKTNPESLAYIMYTSGSSGYPKGVTQSHRNVLHYIMNYTNGLHISNSDRLSLIPSFSFSAAMMDTFAALVNGAALCLYNIRKEGYSKLGRWLIDEKITIYHSVPTVFRHFAASITPDMVFTDLRLIDFGGEPVSRMDVELFKKYFSDSCILVNGLGATELNVIRQFYIGKKTVQADNLIPVGYQVKDTEIILIDEDGREVKYNREGEIVIRSEFLSPGYWGMEEQTEKVFKECPSDSKKRLYFTGDLGRLRTDGCLEHLGRRDMQVKIRGIRIELAEIETVLLEMPSIKEAAVAAEDNEQGNKQLVAYLVESEGNKLNLEEVINHLRGRVPEYMIPASFIRLDAFPLTLTGKVDRRMLPVIGKGLMDAEGKKDGQQIIAGERLDAKTGFRAPENEKESLLVGIWQDVLRIEKVSIDDDFFQIGGDSLTALRVIDLASKKGLKISPSQLSRTRTIEKLVQLLDEVSKQSEDKAKAQTAARQKSGSSKCVPLTSSQSWYLHSCLQRVLPHRHNLSTLFESDFKLDTGLLKRAVSHLFDCHEALRARFVKEGVEWKQYIAGSMEEIPFHTYDYSATPEADQKKAIEDAVEELQNALDLSRGPLIRFAYFQMGEGRPDRLFMTMHHLVGDNISFKILMNDIQTMYRQLEEGRAIDIPDAMVTFSEYVDELYNYCSSDTLKGEVDYWMNLPWDQAVVENPDLSDPVEKNIESSYVCLTTVMSEAETEKLLYAVPTSNRTSLDNILLTAAIEALGQWLNQKYIYVEGIHSGRTSAPFTGDMNLSRTVGWLCIAKSFVLERPGIQCGSFSEKIRFVDEQISRIPNQGIGYALLARMGCETSDIAKKFLSRPPYRPIFFNYLGRMEDDFSEIRVAKENTGLRSHPDDKRYSFLECISYLNDGKLYHEWRYSRDVYLRSTIEKLAAENVHYLKKIIDES